MAKEKQNKKIKQERKRIEKEINESHSLGSTIKLIVVILLILGMFYGFTIMVLNKKTNKIDSNSSIQYSKILAGETFDMNEDDYIVFFYDINGASSADYAEMVSKYKDKKNHVTIYTVDLNEGLNKSYVSDEITPDAKDALSLKVKDATMIRIKNHEITDYINTDFSNYLDSTVE